jgi:hypothetical protein
LKSPWVDLSTKGQPVNSSAPTTIKKKDLIPLPGSN